MYSKMNTVKYISVLFTNPLKRHNRCIKNVQTDSKQKYTDTVLLPRTQFPRLVKGKKRVEMDKYLLEKCGFSDLYNWQRQHLTGPDFVLHDGPPYANGVPHMGHAINKILKDITLRSKVIYGQRVHYIPGWDCHGLPIELKALGNANDNSKNLRPLEIRRRARAFANEAISKQRDVFMSWGIMANWKDSGCYFTNRASYVENELCQFVNLYEKKLVYTAFKPVYWSPSSRTALAESELEYNEKHVSTAVIVRLQVDTLPPKLNCFENQTVYALTWTTTPWTLVPNQALAFSKDIKYCIAEGTDGHLYIVAQNLIKNIEEKIGPLRPLTTFLGDELYGAQYHHPITKDRLPFLPGSHVTENLGTGLVHTAPAHGSEDFIVALENNMSVTAVVDNEGRYTRAAGPQFHGAEVLDEGTKKVLQCIGSNVLHTEAYTHSYPYDWRTKKPVIIRASQQWFFDIDAIKTKALESIEDIQIYPENCRTAYINGFLAQIKNRPYWCISRQRSWGTPIPALYYKSTGEAIVNRKLVERLCQLVNQYGSDCWWELPIEVLIGKELCDELNINANDIKKGEDIMDIWLDSGISWSAVLPEKKADLYLEGMDQFNGWFQSALLTSIALQGCAPYRALFVHGFAVDAKATKMSKSVGNVVNPEDIVNGGANLSKNPVYGIDTLRWWVAKHGSQHSQIPVTQELLNASKEDVQKLRSIFCFLLGALHPYSPESTAEPQYFHLDRYMLHCLYCYSKKIQNFYNNYQYHHVCKIVLNFVANDVSSLYCHIIKDRLYCEPVTSTYREAAVEVIGEILTVLIRSIAPILPHLAEEVWLHYPENLASTPLYHTQFVTPETWYQPETVQYINTALQLRDKVNKATDKNTWELVGTIYATKADYTSLSILHTEKQSSTSELCDILQLSSVSVLEDDSLSETIIELDNIKGALCKRCRRHVEIHQHGLCDRCMKILDNTMAASACT